MRTKVVRQGVGAVIVFFALAWLIGSKKISFDWERSLVLRVATLGALSLALAIWGRKSSNSLEGITKNQSFKRVFFVVAVSLLIYFFVWPWAGEKWSEILAASAQVEQAQAVQKNMYGDIERTEVATEARPLRVTPRSKITRVTWGPVGNVAYSVTYPSPFNDSLVTVIYTKNGPHIELPFPLRWMEFRPVGEDSVVMIVRQREP